MRAVLSVIVPTRDAAQDLPLLLATLMEGVEAGLIRELIVSDGGSTDATARIAEEAGALWCEGPASRGGQLAHGARAAGGDWFLFLHADSALQKGWSDVVIGQIRDGRPGYFHLAFDARGIAPRLVAGWANLRARLFHLPYGDQGLLISRAEYESLGGFAEIPLMEDVAMARQIGARLTMMPLAIRTSAERYQREGWLRRGAGNLWLLLRYLSGVSPADLHPRY